jgi:hypothetical protein
MNHKEILSRAWKILWSYKALWVFGIILALTATSFPDSIWQSGASNNNREREGSTLQPGDDFREEFGRAMREAAQEFDLLFNKTLPEEFGQAAIMIALYVGCVIVILIVLGGILRYVSETAIVKLVDEHETSGTKYTVRKGFRLGFSRSAWRLFLMDLIINVPVFLAFALLTLVVLSPLLLWATDNTAVSVIGTVAAVGLFFLVVVLAIITAAALSLFKRFFYRTCILAEMGVIDSIKQGYQLVRANLKDVATLWLILIGINLGFTLAIIPVVFLLLAIAAVVAGLLGLTVSGVSSLFAGDSQSLIAGLVVGVPLFFLLLVAPLIFLSGLKETFISSSWTLAYREVRALGSLDPETEMDQGAPELEEPSKA